MAETRHEVKFGPLEPAEQQVIEHIAKRASAMAAANGFRDPRMEALMDVEACHCNGTPLRLLELAEADDFNFAHDVFGIRRHIDRKTGRLGDCFLPRFASTTQSAA